MLFHGFPHQFLSVTVVAVYALNDEFKSIQRECKNGQVSGPSYAIAKITLVTPFMLLFAVSSIGIPAFLVQDVPGEAASRFFFLFAALYFVFESVAEVLSIFIDDPILGMLCFMNFWFASFLFGGFVIPYDDLYIPWTLFYHIMPFSYFVRSAIYLSFAYATFEHCPVGSFSAVCIQEESPGAGVPGIQVIDFYSNIMPIADADDTVGRDILILVVIGIVYKIIYAVGVIVKTRKVANIEDSSESPSVYHSAKEVVAKEKKTSPPVPQRKMGPNLTPVVVDDFSEELTV